MLKNIEWEMWENTIGDKFINIDDMDNSLCALSQINNILINLTN